MNKTIKTAKVRAFTTSAPGSGNVAGVVLNAENLSSIQRQNIAAQLGYSETAFHSIDRDGTDHLEFFTPLKRINNCGHATVATLGLLSKEKKDGELSVKISNASYLVRIKDSQVGLRQPIHSVSHVDKKWEHLISSSLNIPSFSKDRIYLVDNGVKFLVIELESLQTLTSLRPQFDQIQTISSELDLVGYYLFTRDSGDKNHVYSRMFAPHYGIEEESATGMGAICLMGLLAKLEQKSFLRITQGKGMTPPQEAELNLVVEENFVWVFGKYEVESESVLNIAEIGLST